MDVKELKSLEEHNAGARKRHRNDTTACDDPWLPCGLACPECGKELQENKLMALTSIPPQSQVRCICGYFGYKVR